MNLQRLIGVIRIAGPIVIAVLLVTGVVWLQTADRREPVSIGEMRRHLLSQMTDDQIRTLHEKAVLESAEQTARRAEVLASQAQDRDMHLERCSDPAYRTRNRTSCSTPIMGLGIQMPSTSVDAVFERMLLGVCVFNRTRHDAREMGCLP